MDGQPVDDRPDDDRRQLAERLQALCLAGGWTVATAESCTGGLVADSLTDVPGSSGYLLGGVIAYADAVKTNQLGVPSAMLEAHGAVSAHVARAMATGARERFDATLAVSITGISGPDGGSSAKPVGLTYLGLAGPEGVEVRRFVWSGDRLANKRASARAAIALLVDGAERLAADPASAPGRQSEPAGAGRSGGGR